MSPVLNHNPTTNTVRAAEQLVSVTNMLTETRRFGAPVIGTLLVLGTELRPNIEVFQACTRIDDALSANRMNIRKAASIGAILLSITDLEGNAYRFARHLDPSITNPGGGERDHSADKQLFYCLMAGLSARRYMQGENKDAAFMAGILAANYTRDIAMRHERERAKRKDENISTDAIMINKYKTLLLLTGAVTATTDYGESGKGRVIAHSLLFGGTTLGTIGFFQFRSLMHQRISASDTP